ncbi:hypothetical protein SADUNF_Sadunf01G0174900 [Salix dunnii]|uniref:Uncharacterized protein n=1 Tax=Salix dunnii TaxID=1413687 RepID=A0A835TM86_9ROSI|nr:hypothetical protein SADUNF_Sadunf01G0174900 [Salix dunnii]
MRNAMVLLTDSIFMTKMKAVSSAMGSTSVASETDNQQPECTGERIDLLVSIGLLKIVSGVSGLTKETLPETFMLNLSRLRAVQAEIQKIIHDAFLRPDGLTGKSSPETRVVVGGIGLDFPESDTVPFPSPRRIPRKLKKRLLEAKTPTTHLRRQPFYEKLSSKARPKPRSPSQCSSHEAKLHAAEQKRQRDRAEFLGQRGLRHSSVPVNWNKMHHQADLLSRKIASYIICTYYFVKCWRQFLRSRRTTIDLAKDFDALKINENCAKSMPFEQLARMLQSTGTLRTVEGLLDRLESRFRVSMAVASMDHPSSLDNIDHLLKRVPPLRKGLLPGLDIQMLFSVVKGSEREIALAKSAEAFTREFEFLTRIILDGPMHSSDEESESMSQKRCTFRSQLAAFDKEWCSYLNCFVVWKVKDAHSLEGDLERAKCKLTPGGSNDALTHDMKAIQKQVAEDQKVLREKVQHLSGDAGIERMGIARSKYFQAKENGSPVGSPIMHFQSPSMPLRAPSVAPPANRNNAKPCSSSASSSSCFDGPAGSAVGKLVTENELIVNEFLHEKRHGFVDRFNIYDKDESSIKAKVRETMEAAFWDRVM